MSQSIASGRTGEPRFQAPPSPRGSAEWEGWDRQLAADDPARGLVAAMAMLDLQPLWNSYGGRGSLPYCPRSMLAMVLIEKQRGRESPSQWHRDQRDSIALLWAGQGIQPARSVWYDFRDRLGPVLDQFVQQVLERAFTLGMTDGKEVAGDGTFIAASASRHCLLNQKQLLSRLAQLAAVGAADQNDATENDSSAASATVLKKVLGWRRQRAGASSSRSVFTARGNCCSHA